jgi:hypothetical protein
MAWMPVYTGMTTCQESICRIRHDLLALTKRPRDLPSREQKQVVVSRDMGNVIGIASGLTASDRVIESPPDGIAAGDQVRIAGAEGTGNTSTAAAGKCQQPSVKKARRDIRRNKAEL